MIIWYVIGTIVGAFLAMLYIVAKQKIEIEKLWQALSQLEAQKLDKEP